MTKSNKFEVMQNGDANIARDANIGGNIKIGNTVLSETKLIEILGLLDTLNNLSPDDERNCLKQRYNTLSTC
jgi:hypothetical protein